MTEQISRREFIGRTLAAGTALSIKPTGCRRAGMNGRSQTRPNVVYVLTDQWRAQATGYAGDPNVKTPHLDELARCSITVPTAVSVCPVCTPYRASLMTGRYPLSTGMFMNDLYLPQNELCMGEIFKQAGYDTAYIGKWHLDGHGRDVFIPKERRQGFDYWKVLECTHQYNHSFYYADDDPVKRTWHGYDAYAQTEDAQHYIRTHAGSERPFLLFVSFGAPHFPHDTAPDQLKALYPPDSIELRPNVPEGMKETARREAQGYYAHCTALDSCIGTLQKTLEETGIDGQTIFVFTSDHGEMLGSQGQPPKRKQRPWDESILVPFLLRYPALHGRGGWSMTTPLVTPDILPTLLSLAGLAIPETVEGEDLSRFFRDRSLREDRAVMFMNVAPFDRPKREGFRGIRTPRYSYVCHPEGPWLLYDTQDDPWQMNNLAGNPACAALQKRLDSMLRSQLRRRGDAFQGKQYYLNQWGYNVNRGGEIPYYFERNIPDDFTAQSPRKR